MVLVVVVCVLNCAVPLGLHPIEGIIPVAGLPPHQPQIVDGLVVRGLVNNAANIIVPLIAFSFGQPPMTSRGVPGGGSGQLDRLAGRQLFPNIAIQSLQVCATSAHGLAF